MKVFNLVFQHGRVLKTRPINCLSARLLYEWMCWVARLKNYSLATIKNAVIQENVRTDKVNESVRWLECFYITRQPIQQPTGDQDVGLLLYDGLLDFCH